MNSSAANCHKSTSTALNGAHGAQASFSGKTGNKLNDAGMGRTGLENMKGGKTGTPAPQAFDAKAGGHVHAEGS